MTAGLAERMEERWWYWRRNVALAAEARHVGDHPLTQLGIAGSGRRVRGEVAVATDELLAATGLGPVADRLAGEISTGRGPRRKGDRSLRPTPRQPRRRARPRDS